MKKLYKFASILLIVLSLTGCSQGVNLTTEQNDMIANYAARVVIRMTEKNYIYVPNIVVPEPEEPTTPVDTRTPEEIAADNAAKYEELAQTIDMGELVISYKDSVIADEYPLDDDALFVLPAESGYKLVVVEYNLYNPGTEPVSYTTGEEIPLFRLVIDDKTSVRSFKNILTNDFANLKNFTIGPGETTTAIVVFQIEDAQAAKLTDIVVQYNNNGLYKKLPSETN